IATMQRKITSQTERMAHLLSEYLQSGLSLEELDTSHAPDSTFSITDILRSYSRCCHWWARTFRNNPQFRSPRFTITADHYPHRSARLAGSIAGTSNRYFSELKTSSPLLASNCPKSRS